MNKLNLHSEEGSLHTVRGTVVEIITSRDQMMSGWDVVNDDDFPMAMVQFHGMFDVDGSRLRGDDAQFIFERTGDLKVGDHIEAQYTSLGPNYRYDIDYYRPGITGWKRADTGLTIGLPIKW